MPTLKAVQDEKIMAMWGAGMFNDPRTGSPDVRKVVRMLGESIAVEYFDDTEQDENKALMEGRAWLNAAKDEQTVAAIAEYQQNMQAYQQQAQEMAMQGVDVAAILPPPQMPVKLPIVRDFYDHETHIIVHNRFRKTNEYDEMPPEMQMIIDQHVAEHQQYLMAPQIEAQQRQQAEQQAQAEAQAQESDKERQFQAESKQQDHNNKLEQELVKGNLMQMNR